MVRECENCGRIIRGAGRKYCSYCRNSAEVRNNREEDYLPENENYYSQKRESNWGPFFVLLFIGLIVASFFILSDGGKEDLGVVGDSANTTCQYKAQQDTGKVVSYLQDGDGNKYENPIQAINFNSQGRCPALGCSGGSPCSCKTSFILRNTLDKKVSFKIQYSVTHNRIAGYNVGSTNIHQESEELILNPFEDYLLTNEYADYCDDQECSVNQNSVRIIYQSNSQLELKTDKIYEEVCKKCDGEICLNDGEKCSSNSVCGSGICNIVGFCGTEKITECPAGLQNCNNESCLEIGVKKVGEFYSCEFECKTHYGEDGVCKTLLKEKIFKIVFIAIFLLIFAFVVYIILSDKKLIEIVRRLKR